MTSLRPSGAKIQNSCAQNGRGPHGRYNIHSKSTSGIVGHNGPKDHNNWSKFLETWLHTQYPSTKLENFQQNASRIW